MAVRTDAFDLGRLQLSSGEGRRLVLGVGFDAMDFAGTRYAVDPPLADATLDVSRMTHGGYALRLRFAVALHGPCMRCLDDAHPETAVDVREVHQENGGEELASPYVSGDELDLARLGPRRARARAARPGALPSRLRRAVSALRGEPQPRPVARARARARPALGEAARAEVRLTDTPSRCLPGSGACDRLFFASPCSRPPRCSSPAAAAAATRRRTKAQYGKNASRVCAQLEKKTNDAAQGSPTTPDQIAAYADRLSKVLSDGVQSLDNVQRPDGKDGDAAKAYVDELRKQIDGQVKPALTDLKNAAQKKDTAGVQAAAQKIRAVDNTKVKQLARQAGATGCAS